MNVDKREELLIPQYGDRLVSLMVQSEGREELPAHASSLPRLQLTARNICDLELLASGAFSPLESFLGEDDHRHVIGEMRLASGKLVFIPITLHVTPQDGLRLESEIALADQQNHLLAIMRVEEIYEWDLQVEAPKRMPRGFSYIS